MHSLFSCLWMVCSSHEDGVRKLAAELIKRIGAEPLVAPVYAGTVEDAQRLGLPVSRRGSTAIVSTVGPMVKVAGWMARYGVAGSRETQMALTAALEDEDIEQIIWVMDTPGGSVDGLEELSATVRAVNAQKPITVQVDGLLASAGYYVAAHAANIFAAPGDLIGSIGTRMALYDYSEYFKEAGIKVIPIDTGEHKSAGLMGTEITDAQIAEFQRITDGYFQMFLESVMSGRSMDEKTLKQYADGRVFFASESVGMGLIDGVQTLAQTIAQIASPQLQKRNSQKARAALARASVSSA